MAKALTGIRKRFALEYIVDFDAGAAAIRAGYAPSGARGNAAKCLRDKRIQQEISELRQAALPDITRKSLLTELHEIYSNRGEPTFARIRAIEETAKLLHLHEDDQAMPDEINLILRRDRPYGKDRPGDSTAPVAKPSAKGK